jgi:hypothetical protein
MKRINHFIAFINEAYLTWTQNILLRAKFFYKKILLFTLTAWRPALAISKLPLQ